MHLHSRENSLTVEEEAMTVQLQDLTSAELSALEQSYKQDTEMYHNMVMSVSEDPEPLSSDGNLMLSSTSEVRDADPLDYVDPVILAAIDNGGIDYWKKNEARMMALKARVRQTERNLYSADKKIYMRALKELQEDWTLLRSQAVERRERKRRNIR